MTSKWRRCDVVTSHRRHYDVMCLPPPLGPPNILNLPTPMYNGAKYCSLLVLSLWTSNMANDCCVGDGKTLKMWLWTCKTMGEYQKIFIAGQGRVSCGFRLNTMRRKMTMFLANFWLFLFRIFYTRWTMHHFSVHIFPIYMAFLFAL